MTDRTLLIPERTLLVPERTLLILRHGHREQPRAGADSDSGLSTRGQAQADLLLRHLLTRFPGEIPRAYCSPKRRCLETIGPICRHFSVKPEIDRLLDEGVNLESHARAFLSRWKTDSHPLTLACTHGDVAPVLLNRAVGKELMLENAAIAELRLIGGKFRLASLIQVLNGT